MKNQTNKDDIIEQIRTSEDDQEVINFTDKYSRNNAESGLTPTEIEEIRLTGIKKWGELTGLEGHVVGCEVNRHYNMEALISEMSQRPVDGIYRTRSVETGTYAGDVRTMGEPFGFKSAFGVVFKTGRELYGDKFTLEIAEIAFLNACPYRQTERYLSNIDGWFEELN